jgi:polyadenylate-binding protein
MSNNTKEKTNLILCDLSPDTNKKDIESFLSQYLDKIISTQLTEKKPFKATVSFKDYNSANECRINMNQKKLKNKSIRIMWDEKDFLQKNKDNKNNLYVKGIPKNKSSREIYEYFFKFGDMFSVKVNEDEKGNSNGTAFVTYYNQEDAKKAIEGTNGKKIWDSDMEVQYQKNNDKVHYNNNENLKINISNLPDNYQEQDIIKLCEEFGKIHICNVKQGDKGKYAIVKFTTEQEAKKAMEQLNNKEIGDKKLHTKEVKDNHYYNYNNKHNFQPYSFYKPFKFEESFENNNLYVRNIPITANEEDLKKTFGKFGKITSIKLEKEEAKSDDKDAKKIITNRGFGYISFETIENAKNALEQLNGKHMEGFENWSKPLIIDYFMPKEKRQNMMQTNYYGMQNNPMVYPGIPGPFIPYAPQMMMPMQMSNQYKQPYMWHQGNYKNTGFNNYKQRYNNGGYPHRGKGGHRGGYYKNNYQKKNNNDRKNETNTNNTNTPNTSNNVASEEKNKFDYDSFNKLTTSEEKKEFLGERIFTAIQENLAGKDIDIETIGKITGMIIEIPNEKEIIEILEKPSILDSRVNEALSLLKK